MMDVMANSTDSSSLSIFTGLSGNNVTSTVSPPITVLPPPGLPADNGSFWPLIAAVFTFSAIIISLWEISGHLVHFNKPYLQKYVIRILCMVPIYSLNSWFGLTWPRSAIYLDTCRECYEAFVIYSFMKYLLNFLYYEMDLDGVIDCKPRVKHLFPLSFLPTMPGGRRFLHRCRHGVLQYVVVRPITTFLSLFSQIVGIYHEGHYSLRSTWTYLLMANNISQMIAMYSLVIFYTAYRRELAPMRPLGKFLCIKSVVFFSFFQGVIISILVEIGIITSSLVPIWTDKDEPPEMIARNLQDFLICVEMLLAALAHLFAFSHGPFVDLAAIRDPCCFALFRTIDFTDERSDVIDHVRTVRGRMRDVLRSGNDWWRSKYTTYPTYSSAPCLYDDEARVAASVISAAPGSSSSVYYDDYSEPLIPLLPTAGMQSSRRTSNTSKKNYKSTEMVRDIVMPDDDA